MNTQDRRTIADSDRDSDRRTATVPRRVEDRIDDEPRSSDVRLRMLRDLALRTSAARDAEGACRIAADLLAAHPAAVPFAMIYLTGHDGRFAKLTASAGVVAGTSDAPLRIDMGARDWDSLPWPGSRIALPIKRPAAREAAGLLVMGVNRARGLDDDQRVFVELVAIQIATAIADAHSERSRVEPVEFQKGVRRAEEALRAGEASLNADLAAMTRLQELSVRLQAGDPASLLQELVDAATAITGADMAAIQLFGRDSDAVRIAASGGLERTSLDFFNAVRDDLAARGSAGGRGGRVVVEDVETSPTFAGSAARAGLLAVGVRALQCAPLVNRAGRLVGMLSVVYRKARRHRERDRRVLDLLAQQAADWIERMHTEQALQEAEEERQALLASERDARAAAERANRLKDEFLATLSHELRTPIFNQLLWVDLMREEPFDPSIFEEGLITIQRGAKTQARLIDDLLDISRIAAGKLNLEEELVELAAVVQLAIEVVTPLAQEKAIAIERRFDPRPSVMRGDATRLQQVFWNLLTNAIKFTPAGGRVDVHLERSAGELVVRVRDTGQGIEAAFLPHAFDRFRQADSATSPPQGGLGLGLTIVQQLVELHGGSARAESEGLGHGATFIVTLPAESDVGAPGASRARDGVLSPSLRGVRVLCVDDDPDTRRLIARVLTDSHALAEAASSVDEALERIAAFDPHVVISDIGMPGKDGYALIRAIRSSDRHARVPAIALTAFARSADRARSLAAGFDHHVVKPVDAHELRVTVAALIRERGGG